MWKTYLHSFISNAGIESGSEVIFGLKQCKLMETVFSKINRKFSTSKDEAIKWCNCNTEYLPHHNQIDFHPFIPFTYWKSSSNIGDGWRVNKFNSSTESLYLFLKRNSTPGEQLIFQSRVLQKLLINTQIHSGCTMGLRTEHFNSHVQMFSWIPSA